MYLRDQLQPAHATHVDVADYKVKGVALQGSERFLSRPSRTAFVRLAQQYGKQVSNLLFIVNYEDRRCGRDCSHDETYNSEVVREYSIL
jgi:hypothetical protein